MGRGGIATVVAVAAAVVLAGGCSRAEEGGGGPARLVVAAASSLAEAFAEVEERFEAAHPGVDVVVSFAGSATIREQVLAGAPVDVVALASAEAMQPLVAAGVVGPVRPFARNRLQIAVPTGNPAGVVGLADFADADLLLGMCAAGVPCGDLARLVLADAGITPEVDTQEVSVRALLAKVAVRELDAALTYATDVIGSAEVDGIEVRSERTTTYVLAEVGPVGAVAADLASWLLSEEGARVLGRHGFLSP